MGPLCYRRHRFPPEIIQHAIWLYLRFTLSYRDVEELLAERMAITSGSHGLTAKVRLPRFSGRFVSLQSTSWSWRPACRLRRLSVSGIPGPNATAPDYTNPRCS